MTSFRTKPSQTVAEIAMVHSRSDYLKCGEAELRSRLLLWHGITVRLDAPKEVLIKILLLKNYSANRVEEYYRFTLMMAEPIDVKQWILTGA